jgi:hypothetical protein
VLAKLVTTKVMASNIPKYSGKDLWRNRAGIKTGAVCDICFPCGGMIKRAG